MLNSIRIVMVNTTHSGNLGAAARAMKTMGISDLCLVDPIASIDDEAIARASRADGILKNARLVSTLEEAIADCQLVVGTSARGRHIPWPLMTPRQCGELAKAQIAQSPAPVALVFGRESRGLTNEELHLCHAHVHIPTEEEYSSLNVAQAIQLLCYEMRLAALSEAEGDSTDADLFRGVAWDHPPASHEELNGMIQHLERTLIDVGFLNPDTPKQLMTRLRRLYQRAMPDRMEINMLRGFFAAVQRRSKTLGPDNTAAKTEGQEPSSNQSQTK